MSEEYTHELWLKTPFHYARGLDEDDYWVPLCGELDQSDMFCYVASKMLELPNACPKCLAHPDFELHLLGDV